MWLSARALDSLGLEHGQEPRKEEVDCSAAKMGIPIFMYKNYLIHGKLP